MKSIKLTLLLVVTMLFGNYNIVFADINTQTLIKNIGYLEQFNQYKIELSLFKYLNKTKYTEKFSDISNTVDFAIRNQEVKVSIQTNKKNYDLLVNHLNEMLDYTDNVKFDNEYRSNVFDVKIDGFTKNGIYYADLKFTYLMSQEEMFYIDSMAQKIAIKIIDAESSDLEKESDIIDWIITNFEYDNDYIKRDAYDGLTTGKTVCYGYAFMFNKIAYYANLNSQIMLGSMPANNHAWNIVQIEKTWYYVDLSTGDKGSYCNTSYINFDDEFLKKNHPKLKYIKPLISN